MTEQAARDRYAALLAPVVDGRLAAHVKEARLLALPGDVPPWTDTGIELEAGDWITVIASGNVVLSDELGLTVRPRTHLWRRIGDDGPIFRGAHDTASHRADDGGRLSLGIYPGWWTTPAGDYPVSLPLPGAFVALVVRWHADPTTGLRAVAEVIPGDPAIDDEIARLEAPIAKPAGWSPLWHVGDTDLFSSTEADGRRVLHVRPVDEGAILKRAVDTPLTPETRLRWSWRIDELPSRVAEDVLQAHDYLSIAVEFENGQDLSYFWSATLPVGTAFRCPIPFWDACETHLALRSGPDELGRWRTEARNVYEDYRQTVGAPPTRIVGIWLIAVSLFAHGRGAADFADIVIEQPTGPLRVS